MVFALICAVWTTESTLDATPACAHGQQSICSCTNGLEHTPPAGLPGKDLAVEFNPVSATNADVKLLCHLWAVVDSFGGSVYLMSSALSNSLLRSFAICGVDISVI